MNRYDDQDDIPGWRAAEASFGYKSVAEECGSIKTNKHDNELSVLLCWFKNKFHISDRCLTIYTVCIIMNSGIDLPESTSEPIRLLSDGESVVVL